MSAFIVVVVVGACTWVVFRAATQPVEPATAGTGATRAPAPRTAKGPKRRPAPGPVTPPPPEPEVLAPTPILPPPLVDPAPVADERPDEPPVEEPIDEPPTEPVEPVEAVEAPEAGVVVEPLVEPDELEEDEEDELVVVPAPPRVRRGPRSDPGEPAGRPGFATRARSAVILVALASVLGTAVAIGIGLTALVLFNVLRSALG